MKLCTKCQVEKNESEFGKNSVKKDGLQTYCKECAKGYFKDYYQTNKTVHRQRVNKWKEETGFKSSKTYPRHHPLPKSNWRSDYLKEKNRPCTDCNQSYPFYVMEFDHLRDKKIRVSAITSKEQFYEEIAKCEIVCACCHRARSYRARLGNGFKEPNSATKRINRDYVNELKAKTPCADCGQKFKIPWQLDFDHRPGVLKCGGIATIACSNTLEFLKKEIAKCDLVCANCHKVRTYARGKAGWNKTVYEEAVPVLKRPVVRISLLGSNQKFRRSTAHGARKFIWPSREELRSLINEKPISQIGNLYGCNGNSMKKIAKIYKLNIPPRGYWNKLRTGKIPKNDFNPK